MFTREQRDLLFDLVETPDVDFINIHQGKYSEAAIHIKDDQPLECVIPAVDQLLGAHMEPVVESNTITALTLRRVSYKYVIPQFTLLVVTYSKIMEG